MMHKQRIICCTKLFYPKFRGKKQKTKTKITECGFNSVNGMVIIYYGNLIKLLLLTMGNMAQNSSQVAWKSAVNFNLDMWSPNRGDYG